MTVLLSSGRFSSSNPLTDNLLAWYDAQDASTFSFSSAANISQWRDKSGNNRTLIPTGGPPTRDNSINGFTAVRIDGLGGGHPLWHDAGSNIFTVNAGWTCFVVAKTITTSYSNSRFVSAIRAGQNDFAAGNAIFLQHVGSASTVLGAMSNAVLSGSTAATGTTNPFIGCGRATLTAVNARLAGVNTAANAVTPPNTLSQLWVGVNAGGGAAFYDGIVGEIMLYGIAKTDPECVTIEAALAARWGM